MHASASTQNLWERVGCRKCYEIDPQQTICFDLSNHLRKWGSKTFAKPLKKCSAFLTHRSYGRPFLSWTRVINVCHYTKDAKW